MLTVGTQATDQANPLTNWNSAKWRATISGGSDGKVEVANDSSEEDKYRLAVPRRGHVLSTVVEIHSQPIREAVGALARSLKNTECGTRRESLMLPRRESLKMDVVRTDAEMVAWTMVSMWVVGIALEAIPATSSLAEAEEWFFGGGAKQPLTSLVSTSVIGSAQNSLSANSNPSVFYELLPYLLDPHGPGSRLSVRRDPGTRSTQSKKRAEGVFYTPADVAEYMASTCLAALRGAQPPTIFDPACGTGVFLRAALHQLQLRHPEKDSCSLVSDCLFGADIDPWPLDATAFVLLCDCLKAASQPKREPPAESWRQLRMNLACVDTLRIDPAESLSLRNTHIRSVPTSGSRISASALFPGLERGPTVILGNPPYADLGQRDDFEELGRVFETLEVKLESSAEIYMPFIEQLIRLADPEICSGALVLPLSLACNVGSQFAATRKLISKTRGRWRFAFFDREPHALFGEDVKTRNTIMLWSRTPSDEKSVICTGPLRKWRGDSRATMLRSLRFTAVDSDIRAGIPKIEGDCQALALRTLLAQWGRLQQMALSIARVDLAETRDADERTVFVGPTAYNFLNVFLKPLHDPLSGGQVPSEHPLHAVRCVSRADALAIFAILSSHLAYWWWHTHGDGFHVSRRFIAELPFGVQELTGETIAELSKHGADLWALIEKTPVISLNKGRTSVAYTPNGHDEVRRKIDQVLADIVGIDHSFVDELQQFTARTVSATLRNRL